MLQPHPTFNLKTYDLARDAAYAAELRAELYGDEYAVVDTVAFGFAVMRVADLDMYGIQPWQVLTSRTADLDPPARRARLNEILRAATDERVAS